MKERNKASTSEVSINHKELNAHRTSNANLKQKSRNKLNAAAPS